MRLFLWCLIIYTQLSAQENVLLDSVETLLSKRRYSEAIFVFEASNNFEVTRPTTHAALSKAYFYLGQYSRSLALYSQLLQREDLKRDDRFHWIQDYILVAAEIGNFDLCDSLIAVLQPTLHTLQDSTSLARYWNTLGIVYIQSSKCFLANEALYKAESYSRSVNDQKLMSWIASNRGIVYKMMGDYNSAFEKYKASLYQDSLRNDMADISADYQNLGGLLLEMDLYSESRIYFENALKLSRLLGDSGAVGIILNHMAHLYNKHGQVRSSIQCLSSALAITEKTGDKFASADAYYELAEAFRLLPQYDSALYFLSKASVIYSEIDAIDQKFYSILAKSRISSQLKRYEEGNDLLDQAKELLPQLPTNRYWSSYYDARAFYFESLSRWDSASVYYGLALRTIDSIYKNQRFVTVYDASINNDRTRFYKNYIRFLLEQKKYDKALENMLVLKGNILEGDTKKYFDAVFEQGISFFQTDTIIHVLLNYSRETQYRRLTILSSIKNHFLQVKSLLRQPSANIQRLSQHLSKISDWINPAISNYVQSHTDLLIVPDGLLCNFPFELLMINRHHLAETHTIQYTQALKFETSASTDSELFMQTVNILARSDYGSWSSWPDLPGVADEVDRIRSIAPQTSFYHQATEKIYYELADRGSSQILHLIGHGFNSLEDIRESGIVLGPDPALNDGYLTCREIEKKRLNKTVVILSACETAVNMNISHNNIPAIPESFLHSGASSVISTLWKINDNHSVDFIDSFYNNLLQVKSVTKALQLTKRDFIHKNTLPFYWAPWVIWK